ncbi:MAG: TIGR01906 family membrane protein [Chloroflexota bacterium]
MHWQDLTKSIGQILITIAVPVTLTVIAVRLVMSPWFLVVEYNRPGFPEDPYGFTTEQRLEYAPPAVTYLTNRADITYLSDLRLPREEVPIGICVIDPEDPTLCVRFNERELRHMVDVKHVTQGTFRFGTVVALLGAVSIFYLSRTSPAHLRIGLTGGSLLTFGIIGVIIVMALTAWDFFFTGFHRIFFEGDTWLFRYSDTLIRLFPEQFWFDAAIVIGTFVVVGALTIFMVTWLWGRRIGKETESTSVERIRAG